MIRAICTVVVVVLLALTQLAHAQSCPQPAKDAFNKANIAYNKGEYDQAAVLFEQAYDLCPDAYGTLYNLGQMHRLAQNYDKAIIAFQSWLRQARTDPQVPAERIKETEQIVTELADMLAAQKQSNEKPPQGIQTDPSLLGGRQSSDHPGPSPWYKDYVAWAAVAVGVLGLASGLWALQHAGSLEDDARTAPIEEDRLNLLDSADSYRLGGDILLGVGGLSLAAGVVMLVIHDSGGGEDSSSRSGVQAACGIGWCGLRGRF